jgi:hypothetical protein
MDFQSSLWILAFYKGIFDNVFDKVIFGTVIHFNGDFQQTDSIGNF